MINITNLHAFLKLFQSTAGNSWYMLQKNLPTVYAGYLKQLLCSKVTLVDKRWWFTI